MRALLWGVVLGIAIAVACWGLMILRTYVSIPNESRLVASLMLLTPFWLTAVAYAGIIRTGRVRTRVVASVVCAVIACVIGAMCIFVLPSILFFVMG